MGWPNSGTGAPSGTFMVGTPRQMAIFDVDGFDYCHSHWRISTRFAPAGTQVLQPVELHRKFGQSTALDWRSVGAEHALRIPRLSPGLNPGRQFGG